jgi:hypothetical protein
VQKRMSPLPPIADMCGALADVRFVPIGDIAHLVEVKEAANCGSLVRTFLIFSCNHVACTHPRTA